ncbi:MAG: hypothetical protein ACSHWZ_13495 [Sulfitobacter sp.]
MAIAAIMLGGFVGFISFLVSLIGFDASVISAIGAYFIGASCVFTAAALLHLVAPAPVSNRAQTA